MKISRQQIRAYAIVRFSGGTSPSTGTQKHRPDRPEIDHALTFKPDHSMGVDYDHPWAPDPPDQPHLSGPVSLLVHGFVAQII